MSQDRAVPDHDGHLANLLGAVTLEVMSAMAGAIEQATQLTMVEATAVSALANYAEGGSIESLRTAVGLSQPATVRLVQRLADRKLVERRESLADRRVTAVHLTARGRRAVAVIRRVRLDVLREWVLRLPRDRRTALEPVLARMVSADIEPGPDGAALADYRCRLCDPEVCGHPTSCPVTAAVHAGKSSS